MRTRRYCAGCGRLAADRCAYCGNLVPGIPISPRGANRIAASYDRYLDQLGRLDRERNEYIAVHGAEAWDAQLTDDIRALF